MRKLDAVLQEFFDHERLLEGRRQRLWDHIAKINVVAKDKVIFDAMTLAQKGVVYNMVVEAQRPLEEEVRRLQQIIHERECPDEEN